MYDIIKGLVEEYKTVTSDYYDIKNELEGMISNILEEVFDDLVCIACFVDDDQVWFEIEEDERWITEKDLLKVASITHSRNFEKLCFVFEE